MITGPPARRTTRIGATAFPCTDAVDGGRPLAIDDANMARGRERYNISCAVCHGAAGDGQGVVTKYGLTGVASYHNDRLRQASDGDLFNTISNGKGQMLGYGYNITIDDRWRIVNVRARAATQPERAAVRRHARRGSQPRQGQEAAASSGARRASRSAAGPAGPASSRAIGWLRSRGQATQPRPLRRSRRARRRSTLLH